MRELSRVIALLLATSVFDYGCALADARLIKIGVLVPLSGDFAALGEECLHGIEVARSLFSESERNVIKFIPADSRAEPRIALSEFRKLNFQDKVDAIILNRSNVGMAINPLSKQYKLPLLGMVGQPLFIPGNQYALQYWLHSTVEGGEVAKYALAHGSNTAAIITAEDEWMNTLADGFRDAYKGGQGNIVLDESLAPNEMDFQAIVSKMRSLNPDTIYLSLHISQIAPALRRLREIGINAQIYSNFWLAKPEVLLAAGTEATQGARYLEIAWQRKRFIEASASVNPQANDTAMSYACYAAASAVKQVASSSNVRQALLDMRYVDLLDEKLEFRDRSLKYRYAVREINDGKPVLKEELE